MNARTWKAIVLLAGGLSLGAAGTARAIPGPSFDWDPAFFYMPGATFNNMPAGQEMHVVGIISAFGPPFEDLNAMIGPNEYTFHAHGLISLGTGGGPFYTTNFVGGSIEIYEDTSPDASFDPNPPNAGVPGDFQDGTPILTGNFTSFVVQTNSITTFMTGNAEGTIQWTGGTLYERMLQNGEPCPGLFTGGLTWYPPVMIPGYLFRHDGKIDHNCAVPARSSTWGQIKQLYR